MRCTRCKKKLKKGAKFCPACGTRVPPKKGKRIVAFLLAVLLLLSLSTIGLAIYVFVSENFSLKQGQSKIYTAQSTVKIANVEEAIAHAKELGKEFGYENAMSEMTEKVITEIDGDCYYRLQQNYQGIPVYGRTIVYATDTENNVMSVTGNIQDIDKNISLTPSIAENHISTAIKEYLSGLQGYAVSDDIKLGTEDLCLYYVDKNNGYCLSYCVCVDSYEFIVDAHSGNILSACSTIFEDSKESIIGYRGSDVNQENGFPVEKWGEYYYVMSDASRGLIVYTLNYQSSGDGSGIDRRKATLVESVDKIFGNTEAEIALEYEKGATLLQNAIFIHDYYDNLNFIPWLDTVRLYYNDGFYKGKNALGGVSSGAGVVSMGWKTGVECIDTVAHEYTHFVSRNIVNWNGSNESDAMNEAMSDLFGELIESSYNSNAANMTVEPDWVHGNRNMITPSLNGYPTRVTDPNNGGEDFSHGYSTVITHAAYLMWNGIDENSTKKISTDDLAKLWYRSMLMMPSDCNFVECRTLVELAASSMKLSDSQKRCVSEAFDAVGIVNTENRIVDYQLAPNCKLQVIGKDEKPYNDYTVTVTHYDMVGSYAKDQPLFVYRPQQNVTSTKVTSSAPFSLPSEKGVYKISISDNQHPANKTEFLIQVDPKFTKEILTVFTEFEQPLVVNLTPSTNANVYNAYKEAARNTTASGKWNESMSLTANMAISNGSAKTKTKMTMTSDAYVSGYSETDLSKLFMSGSAEMSVLGQTYAWNMRYENGTAHYQYTQPNQTSADLKIDPSFFNFETMTSDMMTKAKMSGNQITFTVPGDKITEVGIAAVNQMSDVDDLKYGDVDVIVAISSEGTIDTITMAFHASLNYQGYDADVDCNIVYRFSQSAVVSNMPSVTIVPCSYTGQESKFDILTVHEVNGNQIVFTAWWYRIWDISHATATLDGNIASFDYTDANNPNIRAKGTIEFTGSKAILTISECSVSEVHKGSYCFNFLAEALTEQQLMEVGHFLGVPDGLDVTYKQSTPYYWEGVGIYCTSVGIYYNKELVAAADVNSLNGGVAGGILMYSGAAS